MGHSKPAVAKDTRLEERIWQKYEDNLVVTTETFECRVCMNDIPPGKGVRLHECLHEFCRPCLTDHIEYSKGAEVDCLQTKCDFKLLQREIKELVDEKTYEAFLERGLQMAEAEASDSYHCKKPDCPLWGFLDEDKVKTFICAVCKKENCVPCEAVHAPVTCQEYKMNKKNDEGAEELLKSKKIMKCPKCSVLLEKNDGCDYMMCGVCCTGICWPTRGPRWGPEGKGDISGGCRCRVIDNKPCDPTCTFCH